MRLIKFRAYLEVSKLMVDWKYLLEHGGLHDLNPPKAFKTHIMQYTGMEDKNGVEIYEGDIVELKYHRDRRYKVKAKVEYGKWEGSFILKYEDNLTTEEYPLYKITANNYLEVVGNIYENEELLKESE